MHGRGRMAIDPRILTMLGRDGRGGGGGQKTSLPIAMGGGGGGGGGGGSNTRAYVAVKSEPPTFVYQGKLHLTTISGVSLL